MSSLHPRQRAAVKAATRRAIDALPAVGETARQAAARILGVTDGTVSKWCADHYDEMLPIGAALVLERESQMPVYAAMFAELTGHRLVAADGDNGGTASLVAGLCRLVGSHGSAVSTISEALADGKIVPREAVDGLAAIASVESAIVEMKRQLTAISCGEGI